MAIKIWNQHPINYQSLVDDNAVFEFGLSIPLLTVLTTCLTVSLVMFCWDQMYTSNRHYTSNILCKLNSYSLVGEGFLFHVVILTSINKLNRRQFWKWKKPCTTWINIRYSQNEVEVSVISNYYISCIGKHRIISEDFNALTSRWQMTHYSMFIFLSL